MAKRNHICCSRLYYKQHGVREGAIFQIKWPTLNYVFQKGTTPPILNVPSSFLRIHSNTLMQHNSPRFSHTNLANAPWILNAQLFAKWAHKHNRLEEGNSALQNTNQARVAFKIIKSHGKKRVESTDQGRNIFDERAVTVKYPCQLPGFNNPKLLHPPHFGSYNANHFNRTCYSYCKNAAVHVSQPNSVSFAHPSSMSFWHSIRIHRSRSPFPCIHSSWSTHCGNSIIESTRLWNKHNGVLLFLVYMLSFLFLFGRAICLWINNQ